MGEELACDGGCKYLKLGGNVYPCNVCEVVRDGKWTHFELDIKQMSDQQFSFIKGISEGVK